MALASTDDDLRLAEEHAASFLLVAALSLAAGSFVYLVLLRLAVPEQVARTVGPAALMVVSAYVLLCYRRRRIRTGMLVLGIGVWLEITIMAVFTGGMKAPAIYLYPLIILMAGWLLGMRAALAFAFASVVACIGLTVAEAAGALSPVPNRSLLLLVIHGGVLIFTTVIVSRIVGSYQERLSEVKRLSQALNGKITDLAASEASFHGLFNTVYEAILIVGRDVRFLDVNEGTARVFCRPRTDIIGGTLASLSAPGLNEPERISARMARAFAGEPQRFEFWGLRSSGEPFPMDMRLVRGFWFGQEVLIASADDITEQHQARTEVQRLNASLEKRVQERTSELTAANRELESFAYSISHDLRAPLRGIDGFSHLLAEEYAGKLDAKGHGYLERVRHAAQHMGALIDDILEISRVTRLEMRRVSVDLGQIAAELLERHFHDRPEPRVECSLATDCKVQGDPQLLRMLMQNLIENALKYSRGKASPKVEFGQERIDGERVFFVRDNGVGFDMKYAGRLFTPFQRLHKPEEFEGNGIGLATVARIVRRHGGRVWAESVPDEHTTIRFTIP